MFIIGKREERVDGDLRNCLGADNINKLYDYLESYYLVMHQQNIIADCKRRYNNANSTYFNACFSWWGPFSLLFKYSQYENMGKEMDRANKALTNSEDEYLVMVGNLNSCYKKIIDSDVLVRMEGAKDFYSTMASEPTSEDLLKDLVLNNELELLEDHLIDKLEFDLDKKYTGKKKKDNYHHYEVLEERLYNVALQNQLLKRTIDKHYDADVVYDVIDTCYDALQRGDTELYTARFDHLNDDIQEYIEETKKSINTDKSNKTKRR